MSETSLLRRLFDQVVELPASDREDAIASLDVDDALRSRLRSMLSVETRLEPVQDEPPPARQHPWPGDGVGAYRLVAPIGEGGMGSVWLAVSRGAPEITVAVKFASATNLGEDEARARLDQERRVLAALDHPGVVPIVDAGATEAGAPFLVLRAIHGRTIDAYAREEALDAMSIVALFEDVARALQHVHEKGIVHRDVKPHNVLVTDDGTPILIDFGAARVTERSDLTAGNLTVGAAPHTPAFASPEQERGETATPSADVYALGVSLRSVLDECGRSRIDRGLAAVLDRASRESSDRRYGSAEALADALEDWRVAAEQRGSRLRYRAILGALVLVVLALAAGRRSGGEAPEPALDHDGVAIGNALLTGLAEMPATEIPADFRTLLAVAQRRGSADWAIAAAVRAAEVGEHEVARSTALDLFEHIGEASAMRRGELAELYSECGLPGPAVAALSRVNVELLEPLERVRFRALDLVNRARAGAEVSGDALQRVAVAMERLEDDGELAREDLEPEGDGAFAIVERLGLSLGEIEVTTRWLEDVDDTAYRDARETPGHMLAPLLELHLRLVIGGHVEPLSDATLEGLEEEIEARTEDDDEEGAALLLSRAWACARIARVLRALGPNPRQARDLARAGLVRLADSNVAPIDVRLRLSALDAAATLRVGQTEDAAARFRTAAANAERAMGKASPFTRTVAMESSSATSVAPLVTSPMTGDVLRLRKAVERETRLRRDRPWWAP